VGKHLSAAARGFVEFARIEARLLARPWLGATRAHPASGAP
jgi:hypothetical protein